MCARPSRAEVDHGSRTSTSQIVDFRHWCCGYLACFHADVSQLLQAYMAVYCILAPNYSCLTLTQEGRPAKPRMWARS